MPIQNDWVGNIAFYCFAGVDARVFRVALLN
jgi:hypothetical protein